MTLRASIGQQHQANITKEWEGDFAAFVKAILTKVPVTDDKASAGWVCGAHFKPAYRHSENYVARHFLSLDYDHIKPEDIERILSGVCGSSAYVAYTTWSHKPDAPRIRVWMPLSRGVSSDEFQAISRRVAGAQGLIELAARESHTPCQFMYRPTQKEGIPFEHWQDTTSPYLDVDKILGEYSDWHDRSLWPRRQENDELYDTRDVESPLNKGGLVGVFCRAFRIAEAIERFALPYRAGSSESRWTYTGGSRADGAVAYDDDTKLHSYHDTDPARGQHNAYDLVRLHRFAALDVFDGADTPINERPSSRAMEEFCRELPELREFFSVGFEPLADERAADGSGESASGALPDEITGAKSLTTDLANARRIQHAFGKQILAVAGVFYIWQETHWRVDIHEGFIARQLSQLANLVREDYRSLKSKYETQGTLTEEAEKELAALWAYSYKCEDKSKMDACKELSRKLLHFDADRLNTHRQLFNARNCTINLETGETYAHRAEDFLTECAPTDYDASATCPRFERFLLEIFDGDTELVAFMKRWLGYCITGETREQALVFHVGRSGNGKSTLMRVLEHVLGGYAVMGPRSLLTGKAEIKNDIAMLPGKRMITLNETKQNEEFDQAQLKELTGGDKLTARFLHKEFFEFAPTHKLQIFTNHEPNITGDDAGMWRRLLLVRYKVRYGTPEEVSSGEFHKVKDMTLEDTLKVEAPGILRWLVDGAREWYAARLAAPPGVLADTRDLRDQLDLIEQFLRERTVLEAEATLPYANCTESLYKAYTGWIGENGQRAWGRNKFLRAVRNARPSLIEHKWEEKGEWFRGFKGIRLRKNSDFN